MERSGRCHFTAKYNKNIMGQFDIKYRLKIHGEQNILSLRQYSSKNAKSTSKYKKKSDNLQ